MNKQENENIAVIFDMDGVIIDSNPLITRAWKDFFAAHGVALSDEQLRQYVFGRTVNDTLTMVLDRQPTKNEIAKCEAEVNGNVKRLYQAEGRIVDGFTPFVKSLIENDILVAIATSAPPENVNIVLQLAGAEHYFTIISNASHVKHSKPHPEIYLTTAERLKVDPARCVVFEDSFSGIQSARSAGMKVIGVTTTHSDEEFAGLTDDNVSDFTVLSVAEVKELVAQQ
jgi:beta-phosphoglucomutase family hydrolase